MTVPARRIVGFHQDEERHWVAELECGHAQHVRHDPPWQERPWVVSEAGRTSRLGTELPCPHCVPRMSPEATAAGERVRSALLRAAQEAYDDAALRGLCSEGAWEVALSAMRTLDLSPALAASPPPGTA